MRDDWSEQVARFVKKVHFAHPEAVIRIKSGSNLVVVAPPGDTALKIGSPFCITEISEDPLKYADEAILYLAAHFRQEIKSELRGKPPKQVPVELVGGPHDGQVHYVGAGTMTVCIPHETQIFQYVLKHDRKMHFTPIGLPPKQT